MNDHEKVLRECPFCGGKARVQHDYQWWVECLECGAGSPASAPMDEAGAIAAWNRRAAIGERGEPWRPIESAPKDGTEVFVYVPGDSRHPTAARYDTREHFEKEYGDPEYMEEGWRWSFGYPSDFHEEVIEPTHWMPLPAAPKEQSNES